MTKHEFDLLCALITKDSVSFSHGFDRQAVSISSDKNLFLVYDKDEIPTNRFFLMTNQNDVEEYINRD